ncbi:hypothetical protein CSAL01_12615 [Colletotrichum salicis]|uniref:Peptidase S8/S53 domain-containing protein n=1 Tax=Colletotrichum salicis TaxID=1209931 RepID=A0A135VAG3_9PEZI|nr:hypothetical protein CSAL01_12615 [Colletotrichum salicis]
MDTHPILQRSLDCEAAFERLIISLGCASAPEWVEDCQANFNIWAASIKAKSSGKSSLDHRVRDRKDVSRVICDYLDGLLEALERILEIGSMGFIETETPEISVYRQEALDVRGDDKSDSSISESTTSSDSAEEDSLESLYKEQRTYVYKIMDKLARLSMAIRKSGTKYRYAKIDAQLNENDFEDFRSYQVALLKISQGRQNQSQLCTSTEWVEWMESSGANLSQSPGLLASPIQQRLIQTNILRRHRMQHANRNIPRLARPSKAKNKEELGMDKQIHDKETVYQRNTVASSSRVLSPEPVKALNLDSELLNKAKFAKTESAGPTATKLGSNFDVQKVVARGAFSTTTTRATHTGINQEYPRCPKDCASWDEMFVTSSDLVEHIRQRHGEPSWICEFCVPLLTHSECVFGSSSEWEAHMAEAHPSALLSSQLPMLAEMSKTTKLPSIPCPICGLIDDEQPKDHLSEHVLQHIHEFALLSLPWPTVEDGEITSINSDVAPQMDERQAESVASDMTESDSPDTPDKVFDPEYRKYLQLQLGELRDLSLDVKPSERQNEGQTHSTAVSRDNPRYAEITVLLKTVQAVTSMLSLIPGEYHSLSADVRDRWESSLPKLKQILRWVLVENRDRLEEHAHFINQDLEEVISLIQNEKHSSINNVSSPSQKWLQQFEVINRQLGPAEDHNRVKVAILDTGCNLNNPIFQDSKILHRLLGHWSDSFVESAQMVDEDPRQHGTLLAALLLRLLPEASIFIVRVAKYSQDLPHARLHTAEAIKYAAMHWSVDIFIMAFGFERPGESIESAIREAEKLKQDKVLFFAAANNDKTTAHELLPARYDSVISVHGARHDGTFIQECNPQRHRKGLLRNIYGTLGEDLSLGPGQPTLSGCSLATTIMAAIAACTLRFMSQREVSLGQLLTIMGTRDGTLSLFDIMTGDQNERQAGLRFVEPCQLFKDSDKGLENALALVQQSLQSCYNRFPHSKTQYFQRSAFFFVDTWIQPRDTIALGDIISHPLAPSTRLGKFGSRVTWSEAFETPDFQHSLGVVKQPLIEDYIRILRRLLGTSERVNCDDFLLTATSIETVRFDPLKFVIDMAMWPDSLVKSQASLGEKKPMFVVTGLKIAKGLTLSRKAGGTYDGDTKLSKDAHVPPFQYPKYLGDGKFLFCQILPENDPRMLSRISLNSIVKPASSVRLESNAQNFQPEHRSDLDLPVEYGDMIIAYSLRKITSKQVDDRYVFDQEHFPPDNSFNLSDWEWEI